MKTAVLLRDAARAVVFLLAMAVLSSCAGGSLFRAQEKPSMAELTYRAADMLSQQTQGSVPRDTPLRIGRIVDITSTNASMPFGRTVGSQIAARFVQLGYTISADSYDEMNGGMAAAAPEMMTPPGMSYGNAYAPAPVAANVILTGQYAQAEDEVLVNLRLLDATANKVMAAYDFSMPLTRDIKELAEIPGENKGWFGF
jgi:hypothetical protein